MSGEPAPTGDYEALVAWRRRRVDAEPDRFMGIPTRWFDDFTVRCTSGHVSKGVLKSEALGRDACPACLAPVVMTFPEDRE